MIKTEGKMHAEIVERLNAEGLKSDKIAVATICRGTDHLIILGDETIGEYNHKSKKLTLYGPEKQMIQE